MDTDTQKMVTPRLVDWARDRGCAQFTRPCPDVCTPTIHAGNVRPLLLRSHVKRGRPTCTRIGRPKRLRYWTCTHANWASTLVHELVANHRPLAACIGRPNTRLDFRDYELPQKFLGVHETLGEVACPHISTSNHEAFARPRSFLGVHISPRGFWMPTHTDALPGIFLHVHTYVRIPTKSSWAGTYAYGLPRRLWAVTHIDGRPRSLPALPHKRMDLHAQVCTPRKSYGRPHI